MNNVINVNQGDDFGNDPLGVDRAAVPEDGTGIENVLNGGVLPLAKGPKF